MRSKKKNFLHFLLLPGFVHTFLEHNLRLKKMSKKSVFAEIF